MCDSGEALSAFARRRAGMLYFKVLTGPFGATKVVVNGESEGDQEFVALCLRAIQDALRCYGTRN